jgi:hypothetical protein
LEFGSLKKKTHKDFKNIAPFKTLKKYVFGTNVFKIKIATHIDL